MKNIALITGVTGQDGSYLSEFLLEKGYDVHGIIRRSSVDYRERIAHLEGTPNFHIHYADMTDSMSLVKLVGKVQPTEIYNLAAQSHVQVSFDAPEFTVCSAFWRLFAPTVWRINVKYIRPLHQNYMVKLRRYLKTRIHHFTHTLHMPWQNFMASG